MRIIAGKLKGHRLETPRGVNIRPSSQKAKKALFDILGEKIRGASFLELFAGSGNIGIEAKSRGAKSVFFVENNRSCIKVIKANLRRLGICAQVLPFDAEKAIEVFYKKKQKFDIVFLDPPYYKNELKNTLKKVSLYDILQPHSYLIAEHNKKQVLPQQIHSLRLIFSRSYGDSAFSFYQMRSDLHEKNSCLSGHL